MRILSFLLTVILLVGFISNVYSSQANRIDSRALKEKCKSLTISVYCNIENYDKPGVWRKCYYDECDSLFFDQKGNVLKSFGFDEKWNIRRTEFEYDNLSNRINTKSYDSTGKLLNHTKGNYKYDNKDRIIEESSTSTGDAIVTKYHVDRAKIKYDELGNKTEYCLIDANGKELSKISYRYNEKNQITEESHIITGTSIINTDYYEYDERGNRTLWEHYTRGKLYSRNLTKYDDRNNLIEYVEYENRDGQLKFLFKSTLKYDENNNQTEVNTYNEKGDSIAVGTYNYKYDHQGNWIECIGFNQQKKPTLKIVRKIDYY